MVMGSKSTERNWLVPTLLLSVLLLPVWMYFHQDKSSNLSSNQTQIKELVADHEIRRVNAEKAFIDTDCGGHEQVPTCKMEVTVQNEEGHVFERYLILKGHVVAAMVYGLKKIVALQLPKECTGITDTIFDADTSVDLADKFCKTVVTHEASDADYDMPMPNSKAP
jgi:hypothetical protein